MSNFVAYLKFKNIIYCFRSPSSLNMTESRVKGSFNQMMVNNHPQNFMNLNYLQMIEKVQKIRNSQSEIQTANFQQIFNNEALRKYIQSVSQGHQSNSQVSGFYMLL